MSSLSLLCITKPSLLRCVGPVSTSFRFWRKPPRRKPTFLPMAAHKVFRIPVIPYIPPDEKQLIDDLLEEYNRKIYSIRKVFEEEAKQNVDYKANIKALEEKEEQEFRQLLEENRMENERIRLIREETLEKEFQENVLLLMQMAEEKKKEQELTKIKVEEIVRKEKERAAQYITLENLDAVIEKAIDNPINHCFSLGLDGSITWEGKPSNEYELEIQKRIAKGLKSLEKF